MFPDQWHQATCWDAKESAYRHVHLTDNACTSHSQSVGRIGDLGKSRGALSDTDQKVRA